LQSSHEHIDTSHDVEGVDEPGISVTHIVHVLRAYLPVLLFWLAGISLIYFIVAIKLYLWSPAERLTSQPFRIDFEGAAEGHFPNGTKFNAADIVAGPILSRVYTSNHLSDYVSFGEFSRSLFVLEWNGQYENLLSDYSARLADKTLSPLDRDRVQKDFELKRASISKNEYALYYSRALRARGIPDEIIKKIIGEVLNTWADFAVNQQHVTTYQVSVLSAEILKPNEMEQRELIASIEILRAKANRVISNIATIAKLPGADLVRTPGERASLEETRMRIDEIIRFELDPLVGAVARGTLIGDRPATIRFLQDQLGYDQRQLDAAQRLAQSAREAIAIYEEPMTADRAEPASGQKSALTPRQGGKASPGSEAVMPQLSDTFLDRLLSLSGRSADVQYRQRLVEDYRKAVEDTIPLQQSVAYDNRVFDQVRKGGSAGGHADESAVRKQIEDARAELSRLVTRVNELFQITSRNISPSTQLFTTTGAPTVRTLRAITLQRLALQGILLLAVALPVIAILCFLHNRIREEELTEAARKATGESARL
jgi:hypothetical protein